MLITVPSFQAEMRRSRPTAWQAGWLLAASFGCAWLSTAGAEAQASGPSASEQRTLTGAIRGVAGFAPARSKVLPSLCPGSGDFQDVRDYDGSLGQTRAFVDQHKAPVGRIAANQLCSGTLISKDLFLTAGHCIDAINVGASMVDFNYEKLAGSDQTAVTTSVRIIRIVEDGRVNNLDFAIFQLEGSPGDSFGFAILEAFRPADAHLITIIQHPQGQRKQVEVGHAKSFSEDAIFYDDLDTEHGSSGAGILDDAGRLVGVHSGGDCDAGGPNVGVRMDRISAVSPTVRGLLPGTLLAREARLSRLQVQDFGAAPAAAETAIDAEAVLWLAGLGDERFAFTLRTGTDAGTHLSMFDQLRSAFASNQPIRIEYYRESHRTNRVLRVIASHHAPSFLHHFNDLTLQLDDLTLTR